MKLGWNFKRGGGYKPKTIQGGGMDIFLNNTTPATKMGEGIVHTSKVGHIALLFSAS